LNLSLSVRKAAMLYRTYTLGFQSQIQVEQLTYQNFEDGSGARHNRDLPARHASELRAQMKTSGWETHLAGDAFNDVPAQDGYVAVLRIELDRVANAPGYFGGRERGAAAHKGLVTPARGLDYVGS